MSQLLPFFPQPREVKVGDFGSVIETLAAAYPDASYPDASVQRGHQKLAVNTL